MEQEVTIPSSTPILSNDLFDPEAPIRDIIEATTDSLVAAELISTESTQINYPPLPQSVVDAMLPTTPEPRPKRMGRKPKYTNKEQGIPDLTPHFTTSASLSTPAAAPPIVAGNWDSSVLLPKSKKKHPVFERSGSLQPGLTPLSTPAPLALPSSGSSLAVTTLTPPDLSDSLPLPSSRTRDRAKQIETINEMLPRPLKASKRRISPCDQSPSTLAPTSPTTRIIKKPRSSVATPMPGPKAPIFDAPANLSRFTAADASMEVPAEWLELRQKVRQEEAEQEAAKSTEEKAEERLTTTAALPEHAADAKRQQRSASEMTPSRQFQFQPEGTPLVEITPDTQQEIITSLHSTPAVSRGGRSGKIDIGHVRRSNEILQTLRETGEILELNQFRKEVWEWHKRVAGTDHPFAPSIATQTDRSVFIRTLDSLLDEGKLEMTNATIPTITGAIRQAKVYWLPETKKETVTNYIRSLGQAMTLAYGQKSRASTHIAATEFTEVRPAGQHLWRNRKKLEANANGISMSTTQTALAGSILPEDRRAILQADVNVAPIFYGYHSGRNARVATMHTAIVNVFNTDTQAGGVFSTSPRVFGLEMLFNDIPANDWFRSVSWPRYKEDLLKTLRNPATKEKPLRDIPDGIRPKQGFGGHYSKQKMVALLSNMALLKLIDPLVLTDETSAQLIVEQTNGTRTWFKSANSVSEAMFFRLYESAPVYHIATEAAGLVGLLPVQTAEQTKDFWTVVKTAALNDDINALPTMERRLDPTRHAPLTDTLQFSSAEIPKLFQVKGRWRTEARPIEAQRAAIDSIIDHRTVSVKLKTEEELEKFAWEWCLTREILQEQIDARLDKLLSKSGRRQAQERYKAENLRAAERRKNASSELAAKIAEIRAATRLEWEKRVKDAAERTGTEPTKDLEEYLEKYTLTMSRFSMAASDSDALTNEAIDEGCRMYQRSKAVGFLALPEQLGPTARKTPIMRRSRKDKKVRGPKPRRGILPDSRP